MGSDTKIYGVGANTLGELITTGTGVVTTWTAIQDGSGNDLTGVIQLSTSHTSEEWAGAAVVTVGATPSDPNLLYTWGLNNNNSLGQMGQYKTQQFHRHLMLEQMILFPQVLEVMQLHFSIEQVVVPFVLLGI